MILEIKVGALSFGGRLFLVSIRPRLKRIREFKGENSMTNLDFNEFWGMEWIFNLYHSRFQTLKNYFDL